MCPRGRQWRFAILVLASSLSYGAPRGTHKACRVAPWLRQGLRRAACTRSSIPSKSCCDDGCDASIRWTEEADNAARPCAHIALALGCISQRVILAVCNQFSAQREDERFSDSLRVGYKLCQHPFGLSFSQQVRLFVWRIMKPAHPEQNIHRMTRELV